MPNQTPKHLDSVGPNKEADLGYVVDNDRTRKLDLGYVIEYVGMIKTRVDLGYVIDDVGLTKTKVDLGYVIK